MNVTLWNGFFVGGFKKKLFVVCVALLVIFALFTFTLTTALAANFCPNCGGEGDPAGSFCDLCESCGSCLSCGYACVDCCSEGRRCGECCCQYCGDFCGTCGGCLVCGHGCDPYCSDCGDAYIDDIFDEPVPLFNIFGTPIFMFAPVGMSSWAIFSLLFTVAGIIVSLITIMRAVYQKKIENKYVDKQYSALLRDVDRVTNDAISTLVEGKERYNKRRRLGALMPMYTLSIGALLLLLITQNFRGVITLFDWWVIIHAILFVGVVVCSKLVFRKYEGIPDNSVTAPSSP
jgi:hypothetical protein